MISIRTYLKSPERIYFPIDELDEWEHDMYYMPGAIDLRIRNRTILDLELWDDVDDLWIYIADAGKQCRTSGHGQYGFPSQPIDIWLRDLGADRIQFTVECPEIGLWNTAVCEGEILWPALRRGFEEFLDHTLRLGADKTELIAEVRELVADW